MIQNKKLRAILEAQTKNLHKDDVERLYDFISQIKEDEPELSEFDVVTKSFAMLIEETSRAAEGLTSMADDMTYGTLEQRYGITIEEIKEAHRKNG